MPRFSFSLHRLLELRQLELRQLEMHASAEAQRAAALRREAAGLLDGLAVNSAKEAGGDWMIVQQGAEALRQQALAAQAAASQHEENHQALLAACAEKRVQVEALQSLRASEHTEFLRRQSRRDEAAMQEQVLRKWQAEKRQQTPSQHSGPNSSGPEHPGRVNHG